jgi:hypothetical protein
MVKWVGQYNGDKKEGPRRDGQDVHRNFHPNMEPIYYNFPLKFQFVVGMEVINRQEGSF